MKISRLVLFPLDKNHHTIRHDQVIHLIFCHAAPQYNCGTAYLISMRSAAALPNRDFLQMTGKCTNFVCSDLIQVVNNKG